ncbi:3-hydroxyacyl-CoA dehydrogenase NAD-binding domain-containing protein [Salinivibrio socompensis]|uniref:3-hydroxyacyl-CoA dehydrogenase NAD-binding domain-containing protein n=1 Tax=Salinivibrio socompensis TaxID=1510206 RepID=UPI0004B27393|nr:3-hydroxyacyl-CoA dehydrogenase NAD-binding domain-containing protein [Salinivibrio socompensis]
MSKQLAVIGTGVIGNGWIARALARGWDVVAYDPDPQAPTRTRAFVANAWPSLEKLGLAEGADPARLTFVDSLEQAVKEADLVQENVPERIDIKRETLSAIDAAAAPNAIIGSSTSGFKLPSCRVIVIIFPDASSSHILLIRCICCR